MPVIVNQSMAMHFRFNVFLAALCLLLFFSVSEAFSKSYTIPTIRVEVTVHSNGSVRITEHRRYRFDGSYSWADYRLPFRGFTTIKDIQVTEGTAFFQNENSEAARTFLVERNDESIRIKWFYEAEDEERTFTISYTLEGAVVIGPEWSEFFWNYISAERDKATDSLSVSLQLPTAVSADSIFTWSRGPQDKIRLASTSNGYSVEAIKIDKDEFVQIRSVFPRTVFSEPAVQTTDPDFSLENARNDEATYRIKQTEIAAKNKQYAAYGEQLIVVVVLFSIALFVFFYQRYGKRHSARSVSATETVMLPGRLPPAVAAWLVGNRYIGSHQLMATLLDLARRGYFVIEEQEPENKIFGGKKQIFTIRKSENSPGEELLDWEKHLTEYVIQQINASNRQLDELFSGSSIETSRWFSNWKKMLKAYCWDQGWYDEHSYRGVYLNIGVQLLLLPIAILATIWSGPTGIIGILTVTTFLIASLAIIRRTEQGEITYKKWKAYKQGVSNAGDHTIGNDLIDKHFIYAIAFGLSKDKIESLFKEVDTDQIAFIWFVFHPSSGHTYADAASTFSTLGATGASSFPGASSGATGAGASAGAAGGGAAGGAG